MLESQSWNMIFTENYEEKYKQLAPTLADSFHHVDAHAKHSSLTHTHKQTNIHTEINFVKVTVCKTCCLNHSLDIKLRSQINRNLFKAKPVTLIPFLMDYTCLLMHKSVNIYMDKASTTDSRYVSKLR